MQKSNDLLKMSYIVFLLFLCIFINVSCTSTPEIIPYSKDLSPLEEQCLLVFPSDIHLYMFDDKNLEDTLHGWIDGRIKRAYSIPSGIHSLKFAYGHVGVSAVTTASDLVLKYNFLPERIYAIKYKFIDNIIECWIEELENLEQRY